MKLTINNQLVTLAELREIWLAPVRVTLGPDAKLRITESAERTYRRNPHGAQM